MKLTKTTKEEGQVNTTEDRFKLTKLEEGHVSASKECTELTRQLVENIPNWLYYLQLGILNPKMRILHPIGDF